MLFFFFNSGKLLRVKYLGKSGNFSGHDKDITKFGLPENFDLSDADEITSRSFVIGTNALILLRILLEIFQNSADASLLHATLSLIVCV